MTPSLPASLLRVLLLTAVVGLVGCAGSPRGYPDNARPSIDRRGIDFPSGMQLDIVAKNLTGATAIALDEENGYVYLGDRFPRGDEIRIQRLELETGEIEELYPARNAIVSWFDGRPRLKAPVGGLLVHEGELYVTARGGDGLGLVVAFDIADWKPKDRRPPMRTVVGELPARGDHAVTDLALHPLTGRLFFGVGSATNSGVVGLDNNEAGWLGRHRDFHDVPLVPLKIFGYRFDTEDPFRGLIYPDKVNTAPFNAFGQSGQRIPPADNQKPTAAVYSVDPTGGDLRIEAHGIRHPTGLAFNEFAQLYAANQGMERRGTRPVRDDPDAVLRLFSIESGERPTWYGWPDYSADLLPVTQERFQPVTPLLARTGYDELSFLIDHDASNDGEGLETPNRDALLTAILPSLSGASGMSFIPSDAEGALAAIAGRLVVALRGDKAPFATGNAPINRVLGRQIVVVDIDRNTVNPLVYNTTAGRTPTNDGAGGVLTRPSDLAFGMGGLWILDYGEFTMRGGRERREPASGRLLLLRPLNKPVDVEPATRPEVASSIR
ncbi:MAG: hypothetical protein AAF561_15550 [Planctomycetota bacterium]